MAASSEPAVAASEPSSSSSSSSSSTTKKKFNLLAKNIFLTYPKCDDEQEEVLQRIENTFQSNLKWAVVARELHQDGTHHLHCVISLEKKIRRRRADCFDSLVEPPKHGNYQGCRSVTSTVKYIVKDGNYVSKGIDVEEFLKCKRQKTTPVSALVFEEIEKGTPLFQIYRKYHTYSIQNKRKIDEMWQAFRVEEARQLSIPKFILKDIYRKKDDTNEEVVQWVKENLIDLPKREFKQKQLYLYGPHGTGKTSFVIDRLAKFYRLSIIQKSGEFYNGYDPEADIVFIDEFRGQYPRQWLNSFMQGSPFFINIKGGHIIKTKNQAVIIASNYSVAKAYKEDEDEYLQDASTLALKSRLTEVYVAADQPLRFGYKFIEVSSEEK